MSLLKVKIDTAIWNGDLDKVKSFINKDNVNEVDEDNWTALHEACLYNKLEIVKYLLSIGADVNIKDGLHRTPLDIAKIYNNIEVKDFLQFYMRFNK